MSKVSRVRLHSQRGQQLAEMLAGVILLVPIMLFLLDLSIVLLATQQVDRAAKAGARAAANQTGPKAASAAAIAAVNNTLGSKAGAGFFLARPDPVVVYNPLNAVSCIKAACNANTTAGTVTVTISAPVRLPVPIPIFQQTFTAADTESVVAIFVPGS